MLIERPVLKLGNKPTDELAVSIGNKSIEQHLLMADIRQPFYIKELLSKQDWTIFEEQRPTKRTRAYQPKVMVGLILYGLMQGISSLRDLARMARVDLGCIYITEGIFPDNSSICRFINRYKETLSAAFFINLTRSILKVTRSGVRSLAGDGTIIEAAASRYNLLMSMLDRVNEVDKEGAVEELLLDGGYESIQVLEESINRKISTLCAAGKKGKKSKETVDDKIKKSDFKYDELTDSYICPQGQRLTPLRRGKATATAPAYQTYSTSACHNCPLKEKCTSSKNGRQLKRYDG